MKRFGRYKLLLLVGSSIILLDQITKIWVHRTMKLYDTIPVIPDFFDLHYIRNTGAAFGILSNSQSAFRIPFFVGVSFLAIGIILYLFHQMEESEVMVPLAFSLVLGGAVGNLIDRVHSEIRAFPVAKDAQPLELFPLDINEFSGILPPRLPDVDEGHLPFALPEGLVHMMLDGKPVTIPAGDITAVKAGHEFGLDNNVL